MFRKTLLLIAIFLVSEENVKALNRIDTFIRDHCVSACNGESDNCRPCYNEAVELFTF